MQKKYLVIVESPAKARTLSKILGADFEVVSSMGHLIDLPQKSLGVDIEAGFVPEYELIPGRAKILNQIKKLAKAKEVIYLATDPDREGEAIGWHLKQNLPKDRKIERVEFHEITASAIQQAFKQPREINTNMVNAQQARRILDRLVGYFLSPLLWKKIVRGLSAGRVQSVALRLIVEREREIEKFSPQEYWDIQVELANKRQEHFNAKLEKISGKKAEIKNKEEAQNLVKEIEKETPVVFEIRQKQQRRYPFAPFTTSTLQQEAFNKLRFSVSKTMRVAQSLYEGVELGDEGAVGLITYMRTDSTKVAKEAVAAVRDYIQKKYGKEYLPLEPNVYKVKKTAQEAHEAIRPTSVWRTPESVSKFLNEDQFKLYELISRRFIASQMNPSVYKIISVDIHSGKFQFGLSGRTLVFDGFSKIYEVQDDENNKTKLPDLEKNEVLKFVKIMPQQHFTKPKPRYSESSLVKALEEDGIGRPSTYAPIIYTIVLRDYARRNRGYLKPTELGFKVCDMLLEYFPKIMDVKFTAHMEEELDEIEEGKFKAEFVLKEFYTPFKESLDFAQANIKKEVVTTKEICDKCGKPMVIKWGRKGRFLSCSDYPNCKNAKSISTGVACPVAGCGGYLVERRSKRGFFYGCSNFPKCTYTCRNLPAESSEEISEDKQGLEDKI
ncbi:MAG: type I DNA topoisomerase [Candidatus Omnitrophica bacterium]|nr:type I DNA topoisomerase [Candidatus Omnitrophota bacterium]